MSTNVDKNSAHNSMDALSTLVYTAKKLLKYQELFLVVVRGATIGFKVNVCDI
ncbi:hypothetical protein [Aureispira anguillae]|uniref:Uncharacterized protein n=1 Tax=Aureispira anguillae TaxID=2864201 RepID=A0A915YCJ6_9BACT|nr:hypothetical protein [Aureispira anguillae]BDS10564.1 hypothetical protein AsAng_0012720 [Aureispira anguillae]